jgi:RNA polymerase sigma-70 factor (ECF subfamily)
VRDALVRYEQPLIRYAYRTTGDIGLAREVVQDTFLRLCKADQRTVDPHLQAWLYKVCHNRALDVMKKERRMQPMPEGLASQFPAAAPDPGAAAEHEETGARIRAAVETLPDKQQAVFRLKFEDRLSYKEISDVTGHSLSNVRYFIHTALKALRAELAEATAAVPATEENA